ncbi:hypothetical protein [Ornithinibacillus xuwenensis]|jgi:thiamine kinase-like enzyme|uniref:Uncharacterized protein n=1 Tax=Ornithinibacillus xuwenensis TaxID=3144668 RepID=A0ABU9XH56_9BACI
MDTKKLLKNLGIIQKHLEKNEKWFQHPEKKMGQFEKDMDEWNNRYLKSMNEIEKWIKELEKKLDG